MMLFKIVTTWALFIPVAIANGVTRDLLYKPVVGDLAAHQISTVIAITAFIFLVYFLRRDDFKYLTVFKLLIVGFVWVVMTVIFEFGFGHYIEKLSWERLLADYNILNGRVWSLMLLTELFTPLLVKVVSKLRG